MAMDSSDRGLFYSMMKTSKLDAAKFDAVGGSPRKVKNSLLCDTLSWRSRLDEKQSIFNIIFYHPYQNDDSKR